MLYEVITPVEVRFGRSRTAPVQLGWLGPVITVLWIVGVTNAVNLIDGLDGRNNFV